MKASADRIKEIDAELYNLESRRQGLLKELREIRNAEKLPELPFGKGTPRTNEEKIDLFLNLFGARRDVYPKLWVNHKKGSKGYSPTCGNAPRIGRSPAPERRGPPRHPFAPRPTRTLARPAAQKF